MVLAMRYNDHMDSLPALDRSDIASAAAYRFIYERIIDRMLNLAAVEGSDDNEQGATFFTVEQVNEVVATYAKEMHLARNKDGFAYQALVEHVREAVQSSWMAGEAMQASSPEHWLDGVEITSQAFFQPLLDQLMQEGHASGGYINVKNPSAFFAPDLQQLAERLYGEG